MISVSELDKLIKKVKEAKDSCNTKALTVQRDFAKSTTAREDKDTINSEYFMLTTAAQLISEGITTLENLKKKKLK